MHKNSAVLKILCVLLCLTFNYTFPLRRESSTWNIFAIHNDSRQCDKTKYNIVDRTKKMVAHVENALKIMKDTTDLNEIKKCKKQTKSLGSKNTDDDLSHFEQMVIKKKNPYLDLKELELKYYNPKNTRQSLDPASNLREEPSLCEPLEDGPNVEITNRGLSGFAIPTKLLKVNTAVDTKIKTENIQNDGSAIQPSTEISRKQSDQSNIMLLNALEADIREFEDTKEDLSY